MSWLQIDLFDVEEKNKKLKKINYSLFVEEDMTIIQMTVPKIIKQKNRPAKYI